jgi:hypothetical protein
MIVVFAILAVVGLVYGFLLLVSKPHDKRIPMPDCSVEDPA